MALIKIHADGTFETAHVEATAAIKNSAGPRGVNTVQRIKLDLKDAKEGLKFQGKAKTIISKIDTLRATRERIQKAHQASGKGGPRTAIAHKARVDKVNAAIKTLTSKLYNGKYVSHAIIDKRIHNANERIKTLSTKLVDRIAKTKALRGVKTPTRTPRAPKDHGAAFNAGAKKIAGTISRGIRSELRDHGKTALVPVSNKPGAKAPVAKPSSKKADTATKHATNPSRGAIGNTLSEIKALKARIATGELKGAKLIRAREDLEKQREALRGLRAGKTPANQRTIVVPGKAKHMGGATKIVGKPSGMGDASKKTAVLDKKLTRLRAARTDAKRMANVKKDKELLAQIKAVKAQIAAAKKAK